MIQFCVESVVGGVRSGLLQWEGQVLSTPACLLYNRAGVVPHLTSDLVEDVLSSLDHQSLASITPLPTLYDSPGSELLRDYGKGMHNFINRKSDLVYVSVQDPAQPPPPGYNQEKSTTVWCKGGRRKLSVSDHLSFIKASRPTVFEALCDSVSSDGCKLKRVRKSVNRTLSFLDETIERRSQDEVLSQCAVLGVVVGGDIVAERAQSARETVKRPVDGFVIEGFDLPHSEECFRDILHYSIELLPPEKPRFIHGINTPSEILTAVECGVDVFDGHYPYSVTERGAALIFNTTPSTNLQSFLHQPPEKDNELEINLKEDRYSMDFSPIMKDCVCYACKNHSRAYIHHLLMTKEILASVLLMMHNLTHYLGFFKNLRKLLKVDTNLKHFTISEGKLDARAS